LSPGCRFEDAPPRTPPRIIIRAPGVQNKQKI